MAWRRVVPVEDTVIGEIVVVRQERLSHGAALAGPPGSGVTGLPDSSESDQGASSCNEANSRRAREKDGSATSAARNSESAFKLSRSVSRANRPRR